MSKTVLVTGGSGFIASRALYQLLLDGYKVRRLLTSRRVPPIYTFLSSV